MDIFKTAEDILNEKGSEIHAVKPDTSLAEAIAFMNANNVGAVLVREGESYLGIWTERDLLRTAISPDFDATAAKIGDHMHGPLITARHDDVLMALIDQFLGLRIRHLLIEREGRIIGMLSSGDVMRAALQQRTEELERLQELVHLKYYDEWRWQNKRQKKGGV